MCIQRCVGSFVVAGLFLAGCSSGGEINSVGFDQPIESLESAYLVDLEKRTNGDTYFHSEVMVFSNLQLEEDEVAALLRMEDVVIGDAAMQSNVDPTSAQEWCRFTQDEYRRAHEVLERVAVAGTTIGILSFHTHNADPEESDEIPFHALEAGSYEILPMFVGPGYVEDGTLHFDLAIVQFFGESLGMYREVLADECSRLGDEGSGREALAGKVQSQGMNAFLDSRQIWSGDEGFMTTRRTGSGRWNIELSDLRIGRVDPVGDFRPEDLPDYLGLTGAPPESDFQKEQLPDAHIYDASFKVERMSAVLEYSYEEGE